jgi:itaconate CoA-transferase
MCSGCRVLFEVTMRPLEGITVLALEHAIAAPFCTRQLADQGARVIKIERPGSGDFARAYDDRVRGMASHFVWINRSKESLTLDVKHREAKGILTRLLGQADVLVQNLSPGAAARLGLSYKALQHEYPRLIVCDISGYGDSGPYRDKKAYDLLIQSESGLVSITGTPDEPAKAGNSIADISAGMYAYSNILLALLARGKTGRGSRIDVSLLESMTEWMGYPLYYAFEGAQPPPRTGAAHATIYPYGPFPAGDGGIVMFGLQNEREWKNFCEQVLQQPALTTDSRFNSNKLRVASRDELRALIVAAFTDLKTPEVIARLDAADIANARVNTMQEVWTHEQLRARHRWTEVDTPVGKVPALLPPGMPEGITPRMDPVPSLGEHSDAILRELGYDAATIAKLRAERAI